MSNQAIVDELTALAQAQLGPQFGVAGIDIDGDLPPLRKEEEPAIGKAIEKRRREFMAGRAAARAAMAAIDMPEIAIEAGPDRAPVWPYGLVGSISHSGCVALAVVARAEDVVSIGLDVEDAAPLQNDLMRLILTGPERDRIAHMTKPDQLELGKSIFVAKECAYKAQYPLSRELIGFKSMEIQFEGDTVFTAVRGDKPDCEPMPGRIGTVAGFTLATLAI